MIKTSVAESRNYIHGTAVFVARTPTQIVVAADSRQVDGDGNVLSDEICKIRKFGSGYIVMNGFIGKDDSEYSFFKILRESVKEDFSLGANAEALEAAIKPALTEALNNLKTENEDTFRRNAVEQCPLGFCVFGLVNGSHVFIAKNFLVAEPSAVKISLKIDTTHCPRGGDPKGLYLVGSTEIDERLIKKFPALRSSKPLTESPVKIARLYMQNVISAGIAKVGGPIDIMRVTAANGFEWIQRKDCCRDE